MGFVPNESKITRRGYLILRAMYETQVSYATAHEAVASVALEHPEWDLDVKRTWAEWEANGG